MASRNIVPRADSEGQIGTSSKAWLTCYFDTINVLGEAILAEISTPSNPSAGYNKLYFKSDDKLYRLDSTGNEEEVGAGATATTGTFTNGDLSSGVLTVTHSLGLSAPYAVVIVIFDNNSKRIEPDNTTGATNSVALDLSSYGTLSGTWGYAYLG